MTKNGENGAIPWWIIAIIVFVPMWPVAAYVMGLRFIPPHMTPTGLAATDDPQFFHCMRMFATDFFCPYASCHAPLGTHAAGYYCIPYYWLYGVIGSCGRLLAIPEFWMLRLANTAGGIAYLATVYVFLRTVFPRWQTTAFLLYTLGGGLGGVLYIATGLAGLHDTPDFQPLFFRYAWYELMEGAHLSPISHLARLYYMLSLAGCLGALAAFIHALRTERIPPLAWAATLLFAGTLINLRYGPMAWVLAVLYALCGVRTPPHRRAIYTAVLAVPVVLAWVIGWLMLRTNPTYVPGVTESVRSAMWFSPFVSASALYWIAGAGALWSHARALRGWPRLLGYAGMGYLAAYGLAYIAYNGYYGNALRCLDATAAIRISDPALIGAVIAALWAVARRSPVSTAPDPASTWNLLWLVGGTAVAISAFGQGWFLRFAPQRIMVLLGLPLSILAAQGLEQWRERHPAWAIGWKTAMVAAGVASGTVMWLCFHGPLGYHGPESAFAWPHAEMMSRADADLLPLVRGGTVLAPPEQNPSFGDLAALLPGTRAVYGHMSINMSDVPVSRSRADVARFFAKDTSGDFRRALAEQWCVDYIYCPETPSVDEETVRAFEATSWLEPVARAGHGVVFRVKR